VFGAGGFRYCGNIMAPARDPVFEHDQSLIEGACAIASAIAASFGLVGVNGIDVIAAGGHVRAVEVNPRWSGSMELAERAYGLSVFSTHADACARGGLPAFDLARARQKARAVGKAIVFAREPVTVGDTRPWVDDTSIRDVPQPGERIAAGHPICTIFADADDDAGCYRALVERAERIYSSVAGAMTDGRARLE
jgi:predicted ATP-grasp superfamily ATP-dependent carboligase